MTRDSKKYDFILLGATSFVGKIIIRHLTQRSVSDKPFTWAIAARSAQKMTESLSYLPEDKRPVQFIVDTNDKASIEALCAQTKVIMSTVGPYVLYGEKVVATCVEQGVDYCDLCGESYWIADMIKKYHTQAQATGARIIPAAGFDSVPSDLGVQFLQSVSQARYGKPCSKVLLGVKAVRGGISGGTAASMINTIEDISANPKLRKVLTDPYAECPAEHTFKARQKPIFFARFDALSNSWLAPFIMEPVNTRVVHRSSALQDNAYGESFLYSEASLMGRGIASAIKAFAFSSFFGVFVLLLSLKPTRKLLQKFVLPKPGEGPSATQQEKGFFDMRFYGETDSKEKVIVKVKGAGDPGYGWTAKIITQVALGLAANETLTGGFWTPATLLNSEDYKTLSTFADFTLEEV